MIFLVLLESLFIKRKVLQVTKFLYRVTSYNINNLLKKNGRFKIRIAVEVNTICHFTIADILAKRNRSYKVELK